MVSLTEIKQKYLIKTTKAHKITKTKIKMKTEIMKIEANSK